MHDAVVVGVLQRLADRRHDGQRLLGREAARLHRLPQIHAVDVLHEQKVELAALAEVMHRDDVRMIEGRERLRFLARTVRRSWDSSRAPERRIFKRDEAVERFLPRLVDHAHAAATDEFDDFQLGKGVARSSMVGGVHGSLGKLSVPVPKATCLRRHAGQSSPATAAVAGAPHRGQIAEASVMRISYLRSVGFAKFA